MSAVPVVLRVARAGDAPALGVLHATCWRETYADLMPATVIATSTPEARTHLWRNILDSSEVPATRIVCAESLGKMVGFGACGPQRASSLVEDGFDAEVSALYVRAAAQGEGVGFAIFRELTRDLVDRGFGALALWVLRDNYRARRFYERAGGAAVGVRDEHRAGTIFSEVAYGWRSLDW